MPANDRCTEALAIVLMAKTDKLELQHPFGEFLDGWSYESWAKSKAHETLGLELETGSRGVNYFDGKGMEALGRVEAGDLRELVANLMTHHLRQAGEIDAVSVSEETATVMNG